MKLTTLLKILISLLLLGCKANKSNSNDATPDVDGSTSNIDTSATTDTTTTTVLNLPFYNLTVAPFFTNHPNWFDMVVIDSTDFISASDTSCTGAEMRCEHGGLYQQVAVPQEATCDNLTGRDSLNVFRWRCVDTGTAIYFVSFDFQANRGLSNHLNATSWKSNKFILSKKIGGTSYNIGESTLTTWWTNTVEEATPNPLDGNLISLTSSGTFYTVAASRETDGYNIDGDKVGLVVLENQTLTYNGVAGQNCNNGGEIGVGWNTTICSGAQKYVWIEGQIDSAGLGAIVIGGSSQHTRIHNLRIYKEGVYLRDSNKITVSDYTFDGEYTSYGFSCFNSTNSRFDDMKISNALRGIVISQCNNISLTNFYVSNTDQNGVQFDDSTDIFAVGGLVAHTDWVNLYSSGTSGDIIYSHITAAAINAQQAFTLNGSANYYNVIHSAAANVGGNVLFQNLIGGRTFFHNVAATNTDTRSLSILGDNTNQVTVTGVFYTDASADSCSIVAGASTNLDNTGITNCQSANVNNTIIENVDLTPSFVGQITDDNSNAHTALLDGSGFISYDSITDWNTFDNKFRVYGKGTTSGAILDAGNRDSCTTAGTCAVWDYSLNPADTLLRNYAAHMLPCPSNISGNDTLTSIAASGAQTFLKDSYEIVMDGIGDDDGLCESDESCIFTPNLGAYQGQGDYYQHKCSFTDGTLTGIQIYAFPAN